VNFRTRAGAIGQDRSAWLMLLFVLLGVLLPTGCVLWFMNDAARSQAAGARRSVEEAYRGQLRLVRDRVDTFWRSRAAALQAKPGEWTAADFPRILAASGADSVVLLDPQGAVQYPSPLPAPLDDPTLSRAGWPAAVAIERLRDHPAEAAAAYRKIGDSEPHPRLAALAGQAEIRCLVQSGDKEAALTAIHHRFGGAGSRPAAALDTQGRLIAADELLLALQLMKPGDSRYGATAGRLAAWLNDYRVSMPSAQRLFLMGEVRALAPESAPFPAYSAELLAAQFVESEPLEPGNPSLERCRTGNLWKLTAPDHRAIALYHGESVSTAITGLLAEENRPGTARFAVTPPDATDTGESIAAGPMLPGWQISFSLLNTRLSDDAARRRRTAYLWAGYLAVAAMVLAGLLVAQSLRRQARLARLKTDLVATVSHELKTPLASMRLLLETLLEDGFQNEKTAREYLEMIAGENLRLSRLIENFLTFSRMERNRRKFDFAGTTAEEVIQPAMLAMRERLRGPERNVQVHVAPGLPRLWADRDALVTVLLNLLDNACKYTPGEKRISLSASCENGCVVFAVKDNGIGIALREQKRIFRRFYQVDRRLARETGGCGLGLSIVDFIVRAHGGAVEIESQPGAGSTFRVLLPYETEAGGTGA
jgi:signal transduction histidine kinase